jgi:hypothetical protein
MVNWLRLLGQDGVVCFVCERVVHRHLAVVALPVVSAMIYIRAAIVNPSRFRALGWPHSLGRWKRLFPEKWVFLRNRRPISSICLAWWVRSLPGLFQAATMCEKLVWLQLLMPGLPLIISCLPLLVLHQPMICLCRYGLVFICTLVFHRWLPTVLARVGERSVHILHFKTKISS